MTKYVVVVEADNADELKERLRIAGPSIGVYTAHEIYRDAYDIDYNMFIFRTFPALIDPQPLEDDVYRFDISIEADPQSFDRIKDAVEAAVKFAQKGPDVEVRRLIYTSHGKPVSDGTA